MDYTIQMVKAKETKNKVKYEAAAVQVADTKLYPVVSEVYIAKTAFDAAYPDRIKVVVTV